ncbi:MAG TPA: hypothetical protein VFX33_02120 [Actinomycetales bacterium]|jgi:hypothetical protein|nr:hypothetical protein [Actinomycetales bacterium]
MNTLLHSSRKILTAVAVAAVAVMMGSAAIGVPGAAHHQTGVSQATKEWKPRAATTTTDVVLATKEWKGATPSTKEW